MVVVDLVRWLEVMASAGMGLGCVSVSARGEGMRREASRKDSVRAS